MAALKQEIELEFASVDRNTLTYLEQGVRKKACFAIDDGKIFLDDGDGHFVFEDRTQLPAEAAGSGGSGDIKAAMDGLIIDVLVNEGDQVEAGQTLIVLEAMKMEHRLKAAVSGNVESVLTSVGNQVKTRQLLIRMAERETETKN